jgi:hypothetical protein
MEINVNKTIEEMENCVWPDSTYNSYVAKKTNEFRKVPIKDLTPEACRLLIEQEIGIEYVLPTAIEMLEENILISGDLYDGDLLNTVANIKVIYWDKNKTLLYKFKMLFETNTIEDDEINRAKEKLNSIKKFA